MAPLRVLTAREAVWRPLVWIAALALVAVSSASASNAVEAESPASPVPKRTPPVPVKQPVPPYPKRLQDAGIAGTVLVSFVVNLRGGVEQVVALESPNAELSAVAVEAVKGWKYRPATVDGSAVSVRLRQTLTFGLSVAGRAVPGDVGASAPAPEQPAPR